MSSRASLDWPKDCGEKSEVDASFLKMAGNEMHRMAICRFQVDRLKGEGGNAGLRCICA